MVWRTAWSIVTADIMLTVKFHSKTKTLLIPAFDFYRLLRKALDWNFLNHFNIDGF